MRKAPPGVGGQRDKDVREGEGAQESGEGGLEKGVGAVSLTTPIKVMTQTQNPCFHTLPAPHPRPYPHRANMALQRGAQSSVELLQWLAWGLGPPKTSVFPFPAHPTLPRI